MVASVVPPFAACVHVQGNRSTLGSWSMWTTYECGIFYAPGQKYKCHGLCYLSVHIALVLANCPRCVHVEDQMSKHGPGGFRNKGERGKVYVQTTKACRKYVVPGSTGSVSALQLC